MLLSSFRNHSKTQGPQRKRATRSLSLEQLEDRSVPSTFSVLNLHDSGAGSLRQAILNANSNPGSDIIHFNVAGTIRLTSGALPAITGKLNIDGTTAPGFAGTPVIEVDFNHFGGLQFNPAAVGSALRSLALDNAVGSGVTVNGGGAMVIVGNYIGLGLNGSSVARNSGNGLQLNASFGNVIGGTKAQDHNVISGNRGNGIAINGSSHNRIMANNIGTDVTGTLDRGNGANGILVTAGAADNIIGGVATGGNDPTKFVFVRPPMGNLISGNNADGVLVTGKATGNTLSGNFIGTTASGNAALGNSLDGVAIVNANGNSLIGCTIKDDPFVYYNVISGNGGNGLRVDDSNGTTIQANFFGMNANNDARLGNRLNGVLVEGSSANTVMGGPIPLGNVDAANGQNGLVVRDTASHFVTYNTFCGLAAFSNDLNFGNVRDGMLITSTGGNILIRTNVITCNGNDGIEISGAAEGVRVAGNIIGLNTEGNVPMGNLHNGVEVDGHAHDIVIGGPQATFNIIPHNAISANGGNGVAIVGSANDVSINFSYIGTGLLGGNSFGNAKAGVYLGAGTHSITIGSTSPSLLTVVSGNHGDGVEMQGSNGNSVVGSLIGTDVTGSIPLPNDGNGVLIANSSDNMIGRTTSGANGTSGGAANVIAFNHKDGVFIESGSRNGVRGNSIYSNVLLGIDLRAGANLNQAPPVLTSVRAQPLGLQVSGTLNSTPNTLFTIEFFANDASQPSGRFALGFQVVRTNASGLATFDFFGPLPPAGAHFITATATDPTNNTSEFSAASGVVNLLGS
jgi:hypothetical protein